MPTDRGSAPGGRLWGCVQAFGGGVRSARAIGTVRPGHATDLHTAPPVFVHGASDARSATARRQTGATSLRSTDPGPCKAGVSRRQACQTAEWLPHSMQGSTGAIPSQPPASRDKRDRKAWRGFRTTHPDVLATARPGRHNAAPGTCRRGPLISKAPIGQAREQLWSLHFRRDRDWLQS